MYSSYGFLSNFYVTKTITFLNSPFVLKKFGSLDRRSLEGLIRERVDRISKGGNAASVASMMLEKHTNVNKFLVILLI